MDVIKFAPIPVIVALLAFLLMVISAQFNLLAWVAFITWGAYFLTGINTKSAVREAISFTLGIVAGVVIVILGTAFTPSLGTFAFPVVVGLAGFVIVFLELVPWFDMAPGYFLGAAAFFGAGATADTTTFLAVFIPGMIGLGLGILTATLRSGVFTLEGTKDPLKRS